MGTGPDDTALPQQPDHAHEDDDEPDEIEKYPFSEVSPVARLSADRADSRFGRDDLAARSAHGRFHYALLCGWGNPGVILSINAVFY